MLSPSKYQDFKLGGYKYDQEDHEFLKAASISQDEYDKAKAMKAVPLPLKVDPTWFDIRSQGQEGSCRGHSGAAGGEHCYRVANKGEIIRFSPDAFYYLTQVFDGIRGDNGSTIAGGLKTAMEIGFLPEKYMPYTDQYNPQDLPKDYKELCSPFKVKQHMVFTGPDYFRQAVEWIGLGFGHVDYGIPWSVSLDGKGIASWSGGNSGGHAQACFGYEGNFDNDGLPEFLKPANSWGKAWGPLGGFYLWRRDVFNKVMAHKWSVCVGFSDMESLAPREVDWAEDFPH